MIVIALCGLSFKTFITEQYKQQVLDIDTASLLVGFSSPIRLWVARIFGLILYPAYIMRLKNIIGTFKSIKFWVLFIVVTIFYGLQIYFVCIAVSITKLFLGLIFWLCILTITSIPFFMCQNRNKTTNNNQCSENNNVSKNNLKIVLSKKVFTKMKEIIKNIPKDNYNLFNYIVILFLALAVFFDPEYGFYTFLRILVTTFCGWTIYKIYIREKESKLLLLFGGIAILFNPIVKIVLEYNIWSIIDIIALGILIWWNIFYNKKFNNIEEIAETIKRKAISEILDEINKDV